MALDNATTTKALQLGCGVISTVGDVFAQQFAGRKAIIVADKTTWHVAGAKVAEILARDGIATCEPYIFDEPEMHAEWKYIDRLDAVLAQTDAVAIAVGSGTINDTTKLCSAHQQRPYMVVATAASMDGYVASGASITKDGKKQTFACPAPQAVVADVDIIAGAPEAMTASGYGDLFAKVPAGADWIVADVIGNEKIDPLSWSIVQDGLHSALADPEGARRGDKHAIEQLIEGLLLGGFAMQAYPKTSRPASGAEHQVSHMLNMANFTMANGNMPSHGFQVCMGVLVSLSLYEYLLEMDIEHLDIEACVEAWPSLEEQEAHTRNTFAGSGLEDFCVGEIRAKYVSRDQLRQELTAIRDNWSTLRERLQQQLVSVAEAKRRLQMVGAPTEPEDIDISRSYLKEIIYKSQFIRRRYTIMDVAVRLNRYEEWLDRLFSERGLWPIDR